LVSHAKGGDLNNDRRSSPKHDFSLTPSEVLRYVRAWFHHIGQEKSKTSDWALFGVTTLAMIAAFASAVYLSIQIDDTRHSFRLDERAWVELEPIKVTVTDDPKAPNIRVFTYEVYPKNVGKTVAHDVVVKSVFFSDQNYQPLDKEQIDCFQSLLGPSKETSVPANAPTGLCKEEASEVKVWNENRPVIPSVIAPNATSTVPLIFHGFEQKIGDEGWLTYLLIGRIEYVDVIGVEHWKKYCLVHMGKEFFGCKFGNEEDENRE
jgi:hypothetical protein